jgi:hypothetical protein
LELLAVFSDGDIVELKPKFKDNTRKTPDPYISWSSIFSSGLDYITQKQGLVPSYSPTGSGCVVPPGPAALTLDIFIVFYYPNIIYILFLWVLFFI